MPPFRSPAAEDRRAPGRAHQGQRLHGLAQAHVVGEHAAEPVAVQEAQPVVALQLVRAQLGVKRGRQRQALDAAPPAGRPTAARQAAACSSTIPSWASSSQRPAWKRLIAAERLRRGRPEGRGPRRSVPAAGAAPAGRGRSTRRWAAACVSDLRRGRRRGPRRTPARPRG